MIEVRGKRRRRLRLQKCLAQRIHVIHIRPENVAALLGPRDGFSSIGTTARTLSPPPSRFRATLLPPGQ